MGWLTDDEVEAIKTCRLSEPAPASFEFQHLARHLGEEGPRQRATELLVAFRGVKARECPDCWYAQLDHLHAVAKALDDTEAVQHALVVNEAVREASRQSVRVVKSEEQKDSIRNEMRLLGDNVPTGKAEMTRPSPAVYSPACDLTEVFAQGGPLVCRRVKDAGYSLEKRPVGRQGAIPTKAKLASVKERCVSEVEKATAFVSAVGAKAGVDVVSQFQAMIYEKFNVELFCTEGQDGISISDLYTLLPMVLERRQQVSGELLWELEARFMAFRIDFGTMCNPLEEYMPIFEAIFQLFRYVDKDIMKENGPAVLGLFRSLFSTSLDLLAGSVEVLSRSMGAGLGVLMGAVGAGAAEAAGAAGAVGVGPVTAFVCGAVACALAVRGLVHLVDRWIKYGNHVRVCALFRRNDTIVWRVWVVELMQ
uniref:Uncharacterized protein n=1 Tax=Alexandrium catenella TaxID=2925 RepID=A0A7S1QWE7_ALECA|mmetsp:Transcript_40299/g.108919  ORF Transcript_40299/g.108919 Transcript_40299/m.108919 type:complete len:422 (+) Transcript_40299:115-1380(+)